MHCPDVSIVDFEQVSTGWDCSDGNIIYFKHSQRTDAVRLVLTVTVEFDEGVIFKRSPRWRYNLWNITVLKHKKLRTFTEKFKFPDSWFKKSSINTEIKSLPHSDIETESFNLNLKGFYFEELNYVHYQTNNKQFLNGKETVSRKFSTLVNIH